MLCRIVTVLCAVALADEETDGIVRRSIDEEIGIVSPEAAPSDGSGDQSDESESDSPEAAPSDDSGDQSDESESVQKLSRDELMNLHKMIDKSEDGQASVAEIMNFDSEAQRSIAQKETDKLMDELDDNDDKKVTLSEAMSFIHEDADGSEKSEFGSEEAWTKFEAEKFKAADDNGDNVLDKNELSGFLYPQTDEKVLEVIAKRMLEANDLNNDGKVDLNELEADERIIESDRQDHDMNKDGVWDLQEFMDWESGKVRKGQEIKMIVEIADENKDGQVTVDELDKAQDALAKEHLHNYLVDWARVSRKSDL